jgi:transcription elongation factor Elf1
MATVTRSKALKTFKLSCPLCGASESINLDLNDLNVITCSECNDSFSPEIAKKKVAEQLRRWEAVCSWIALAGEVMDSTGTEAEAE